MDEINPAIRAGQTVRMLGMLQRPRAAANPGEFNWADYYRSERILAAMTIRRAGNVQIISDPGPGLLNYLRSKARHGLAMGFTNAQAVDVALLDAMLLGDRDPALRDIQPLFQQTGTAFQLSVSGLHIGIFAAVLFWWCRWMRLRPRIALAMTTAFVLAYACISLPSHSGIRAGILCIVVAAAFTTTRSLDRLQLLSIAAIAMLLWHPLDVYSAGFQLSFAVVITLSLLLPLVQQWLRERKGPAPAAPVKLSKFQQYASRLRRWGTHLLQFTLLAWLATLPLVACHFGSATTWSVLASLLLFPLVLLVMAAGAMKVVLTLLLPFTGHGLATIAALPVELLLHSVRLLSRLPGSSVTLPSPALWKIILYYALLLAVFFPHRFGLTGRRRWPLRLAPILGVVLIFAPLLHHSSTAVDDGSLRVTLLSIGAGQCGVIELPGGHAVMIDAGSSTVSDVAHSIVEPYFHTLGQTHLDDIFLSHGDYDHISAAGELVNDLNVDQMLISPHFRRNAAGNLPDLSLLDELEALNKPPREVAMGDHIQLGHGAMIEVLWPPATGSWNSNNAGLVLRLTYAGRSVLFPADIQDPAFAGVLNNPAALQSDVLIAPHHGSSEALTPAFLAAVKPRLILSSNFYRLTSKQRRFETMIGKTPLYRTPACGAITVTISKDGEVRMSSYVKHDR
jgi:competence protein ComEC